MARKFVTEDEKAEIVRLYVEEKLGSDTIAKKLEMRSANILKVLNRMGVQMRPILRKKIQKSDEPEIVRMYQEGLSATEIAEKYGVSHSMILKYLEANGCERRNADDTHRRYEIREDFFDVIDTEEKAYFLGFIYADGYNGVDFNTVRIELATKDVDILEKFASIIYKENPLYHIKEIEDVKEINDDGVIKTYKTNYLNINSKHICKVLEDYGCGQAKSLTVKFPMWLIDPEMQRHFIRGYYDGDGGTFVQDLKKINKGATTKICGTQNFLLELNNIVNVQTNIDFGDPYFHNNIYSISFTGNQSSNIFLNWLYKDCKIRLNRKYDNYLRLIERNKITQERAALGTRGYPKSYISDLTRTKK